MGENLKKFDEKQYMSSANFEIYHYKDDEPVNVDLHHHDFYEIFFFLSGDITYIVESKQYTLLPGDVLLINPTELHQPKFGKSNKPYERIVLWMRKSYLEKFRSGNDNLSECFESMDQSHSNLLRVEGVRQQNLLKLLNIIIVENNNQQYGSEALIMCCIGQLLVEINRLIRETPHLYTPLDKGSALVNNVVTYINDHYSEKITLESLATTFYLSKYHLSHEFNRLVGTSIYRYIIQKRLSIAKQMLSVGTTPMDVYQKCGFGDYANFYRAFKSEYGTSPKEFQVEMKKLQDSKK